MAKGNNRSGRQGTAVSAVDAGFRAVGGVDGAEERLIQIEFCLRHGLVVDRALGVDNGDTNLQVEVDFIASVFRRAGSLSSVYTAELGSETFGDERSVCRIE